MDAGILYVECFMLAVIGLIFILCLVVRANRTNSEGNFLNIIILLTAFAAFIAGIGFVGVALEKEKMQKLEEQRTPSCVISECNKMETNIKEDEEIKPVEASYIFNTDVDHRDQIRSIISRHVKMMNKLFEIEESTNSAERIAKVYSEINGEERYFENQLKTLINGIKERAIEVAERLINEKRNEIRSKYVS